MTLRLPPLNSLRAFEAAARHLSFKKAANELHVTPAAVGQQVKALEKNLGVQLFRRRTRALELTPSANACLPKLREGFDALAEAVRRVEEHVATKILKVNAAPSLAAKWLLPKLHRFMTANPGIDVRITASMKLIDGADEGLENAPRANHAEAESDIDIHFGSGNYPGCRVDKLSAVCLIPLCSPSLLKGDHALRTPEDLRHHTLLHDDTLALDPASPGWEKWLEAAGVSGVDASRGSHFSHAALALAAAVDGSGVVLSFSLLAAEDLATGKLIVPFDLSIPLDSAYYLASPETKANDPEVVAFRDWLLEEAKSHETICHDPDPVLAAKNVRKLSKASRVVR